MKNIKLLMLAVMVVIVGIGCKKDATGNFEQSTISVNPSKVFKVPNTPEEMLLVKNLQSLTEVFKVLYQDKANLKLVNAAIFSKAYTDESILLKDLIYPEGSWLSQNSKFKAFSTKWNVSLTRFASNFWNEATRQGNKDLLMLLTKLKPQSSTIAVSATNAINSYNENNGDVEQLSIYFPYSEEFIPVDGGTYEPIASITTATADADEGIGNLPYYQNGVFQYYIPVLINDDYAENNPTHIIGVNGIELLPEPNGTPPPPPPPPGVSRVYIGEAICKNQYDRLISFTGNGGGSEIKYCHMTGYLQPVNGHVTSFQDISSVDFSRKDIRKENWVRTFTVWDDDWVSNDLEQFLGIYEEDNINTRTFNASIKTTLDSFGIPIQATIGFTVTVSSQDDIIKQLKISRNSYFAGAFQNQGQDFSADATFLPLPYTHGWPAYDVHYWNKGGANVGWTWPYNTF